MATTTTRTEYELSEPDENGESTIIGETVREDFDDSVDADLKRAQAEKARAEAAAQHAAETLSLAQARTALAEAEKTELELREMQRLERDILSTDRYHHVYYFRGEVDDSSVQMCIARLNGWRRNEQPSEIELVLFSPGGSVLAGMALYDHLVAMRQEGWKVTTVVRGFAASMGSILLQAGDVRVCGPESYILIHEISTGAIGKISELEDEVAAAQLIMNRVWDIFVSRSNGKLTKAKIRALARRKDFWLDSSEALKLGIVDRIG